MIAECHSFPNMYDMLKAEVDHLAGRSLLATKKTPKTVFSRWKNWHYLTFGGPGWKTIDSRSTSGILGLTIQTSYVEGWWHQNWGSRQVGPRQIGPLADSAANRAPHFFGAQFTLFGKSGPGKLGPWKKFVWQIAPRQIGPWQIGPLADQAHLDFWDKHQCSFNFLHADLAKHDIFSCFHAEYRLQKWQYTLQTAQCTVYICHCVQEQSFD